MIDTCQANTMYSKFYSPNILATGSSEIDQSSYSHHADADVGVAVIDRYTYYNLDFLESQVRESSSKLTMGDLFDSYDEAKIHSHPGVRYDLFPGGEEAARNRLVMDFFGNVQNVEVEDARGANETRWREELEQLSKMIERLKEMDNNSKLYQPRIDNAEAIVQAVAARNLQQAAKVEAKDGWFKQVVGAAALLGCIGVWAAGSWVDS